MAAAVTLIAAFANSDFDQYRREIAAAAAAATGREVAIKGRVSLAFFPYLALKVTKVSLANAAWGSRPAMATVEEFAAEVDLLPFLWSRTVRLDRLVLRGVDIVLETDTKNRGNWEFADKGGPKEKPSKTAAKDDSRLLADLGRVRVERLSVTYRNGVSGRTLAGKIDRMELRADGDALRAVLVANYNGQMVDMNGRVGRLSQLLQPDAPWPFKLDVAAGETRLGLEGTLVEPLLGKGLAVAVRFEGRNLAGVAALAGGEIGKTRPFRLAATASGDIGGALKLADLHLDYGASKLMGDGRIVFQPRPRIDARLSGSLVDLADIGLSFERKRGEADTGRLFSDRPMNLGALAAIDLNLVLDGARVRIDPLNFRQVAGQVILESGRLTLARLDAEFAGGKIAGSLVLDARTPNVGFRTGFRVRDVDLGKVSRLFGDKEIFAGELDGTVDIGGVGRSWRDIMTALTGRIDAGMGQGRINSQFAGYVDMIADFLPALGDDPKRPRGTDVSCFVSRFGIKNGTATADALMLDTGRAAVRGAGTVDLGREVIDILLKTNSTEGRLVTVNVPLHVQGPLLKPTVTPDESAVALGVAGAVAGTALGPIGLLIPLIAALRSSEQAACLPALAQVTARSNAGPAPASSAPK